MGVNAKAMVLPSGSLCYHLRLLSVHPGGWCKDLCLGL